MKILMVMDPNKGYYAGQDVMIQGRFGMPMPDNTKDPRRIYVLDVEAAFEISETP